MGVGSDQKKFYDDNGYLIVNGVFSKEEVSELHAEAHDLIERISKRDGKEDATWNSARTMVNQRTELLHCHNVQFESARFAQLLFDPRLTTLASALMGTPNIQLHHNKLFIKPPKIGSPFPLHQDYPYFPHVNHSMMACMIHLDDAPLQKGCVRVIPASHKRGPLEPISDPGGLFHLPGEAYPLESATPCEAQAGDVLFFGYLTIHGSGANTSDEARTSLLLQLRDASDTPVSDMHTSRGQGMMLSGVNTGRGLSSFVQPLQNGDSVKEH